MKTYRKIMDDFHGRLIAHAAEANEIEEEELIELAGCNGMDLAKLTRLATRLTCGNSEAHWMMAGYVKEMIRDLKKVMKEEDRTVPVEEEIGPMTGTYNSNEKAYIDLVINYAAKISGLDGDELREHARYWHFYLGRETFLLFENIDDSTEASYALATRMTGFIRELENGSEKHLQ